ncbi:putative domain HDIG [Cordyceps fumosorosea ARSEF 2679]|uniref:Putative domain HDIG n=1 Tax=Cordyceps fumosorosea (strain ARSEF 2679) TaxID=1081104 RepID=A0A167SXG4_CORFA|nr:putative domain HDIG [Cordyceps fumosorosea ARSEF 2679]OAA60029.1 putative domain HDIG [Cordyceps fumosorosea ARSEF 2679]
MGVPELRTPASVTEYVLSVLSASERTPYIGEAISQLQHSLQAAALAASALPPVDDLTQVAALLHDIGQFTPAADLRILTTTTGEVQNLGGQADAARSVGRVGHETLGGAMLLALGFPPKVARLVESHVASKRYLCAVDASYHDRLSEASKRSLQFQGGPMDEKEKGGFAAGEWCKEMCQLRRWDDAAKEKDLRVRDLESWRPVIERVLSESMGAAAAA